MRMIKVSIVIPVYNVSNYIERCLLSVLNQVYKNIECILVDDCSPDNSIDIAKNIIASEKSEIEVKIVLHDINKGLSAARNTGLRAASGDYIYFLDSDDEIFPYTINAMVQLCQKYNNVDLVQGSTVVCPYQKGKKWLDIKNKKLPEYSSERSWIKKGMLKRTFFSMTAWNKLVRKDFLLSHNLFFKEGIVHEDEHWNFFVAKHITTIAFCKEDTYLYRINESGIMASYCSPKNITSFNIILLDMYNNIDNFCFKEQKECILDICLRMDSRVVENEHLREFISEKNNRIMDTKKLYKSKNLFDIIFFLNKKKSTSSRVIRYGINKIQIFCKKAIF